MIHLIDKMLGYEVYIEGVEVSNAKILTKFIKLN